MSFHRWSTVVPEADSLASRKGWRHVSADDTGCPARNRFDRPDRCAVGVIRSYVEVQTKTGPKRRVNLRVMLNGWLYKLKRGCRWPLLPRSFSAKSTVHYDFQRWTKQGIWAHIKDALRRRGFGSRSRLGSTSR